MTRLFIENREIELDETVQFAITKQFEDLSNPTTIINDWSKTVSIPFTANNNRIFGHIYSPDKMTVATSDSADHVGIYFDPYRKLNMRLMWGDAILMTGYAKMNEVKQVSGKGTYELTLFGQLGKVFQEMSKITFDKSTSDSTYLIEGRKWVDEYLNKTLVSNSWNSEGQSHIQLYPKYIYPGGGSQPEPHPAYSVHDIIGFAPNNAINEGFDYTTFQTGSENGSATFEDVLGTGFTKATKIEPKTVIPKGMMPREIGEYRSYMQLPFIYWNKLFQIFQDKAEEITGYQFEYDSEWFDDNNPYWTKLVYMLRPRCETLNQTDIVKNMYIWIGLGLTGNGWQTETITFRKDYSTENLPIVVWNGNVGSALTMSDDYSVSLNGAINFRVREQEIGTTATFAPWGKRVYELHLRAHASGGTVIQQQKFLITGHNYTGDTSAYYAHIEVDENPTPLSAYYAVFPFSISAGLTLTKYKCGDTGYFSIEGKWLSGSSGVSGSNPSGYTGTMEHEIDLNTPLNVSVDRNHNRSNSHFDLNTLWNNDVKPFDEILRYCKMYHILISTDDFNKKIKFTPFYRYFQGYTVSDWSDKVDKSKDFVVTPVTFEDKYILFNNDKDDSKVAKDYNERYGVNFGEYRLVTDYNFNTNTNKLFSGNKQPLVNTDASLSWTNLHYNHRVSYSMPNEISVLNKDKDDKYVSPFGRMYYHNGARAFSTEPALNMCSVIVTDDSDFQDSLGTYFYLQRNGVSVRTYPALDVVNSRNMCTFTPPMVCYTYANNYSGKNGIFQNVWYNYVNERYNTQNKKITCHVKLTPTDFVNFKFKNFVKLDNQLCMVNKIYDYDIDNSETTKVELITIQDVTAYTSIPYLYDTINVSSSAVTVEYDHYKVIQVTSTGNWRIVDNEWQDNLTVFPETGTSGTTDVYIGSIDEERGGKLIFEVYDENGQTMASRTVNVSVGGTSTIRVDNWYHAVEQGSSDTVTITSSSRWVVGAIDKRVDGLIVNVSPTASTSSSQSVSISVDWESATGVTDYYVKNQNNDAIMFRVNATKASGPAPGEGTLTFIKWDNYTWQNNINRGQSTTCQIKNDGSTWELVDTTSDDGCTATLSPSSGGTGTQTLRISVPSSSPTGQQYFNLKNNLGGKLQLHVYIY